MVSTPLKNISQNGNLRFRDWRRASWTQTILQLGPLQVKSGQYRHTARRGPLGSCSGFTVTTVEGETKSTAVADLKKLTGVTPAGRRKPKCVSASSTIHALKNKIPKICQDSLLGSKKSVAAPLDQWGACTG